jgi:hypothetical protein
VGSDGGWWLPLLAGRQTTMPPINYTLEAEPQPGYRAQVRAMAALAQAEEFDEAALLEALRAQGVTHVYLGQRQGRLNYNGPVLEPAELLASPNFHLIFHQDRVRVFEIAT